MFVYASFKTFAAANAALEDMFAAGEVCVSEGARIEHRGNRYVIIVPAWC